MVALLHLHCVAESARGTRDDGDLLHGGGVRLLGGDQSVADLVIGYDALLLVGEDGVLLLVARDDDLDALLKVGLRDEAAAVPYGAQGRLVDDVGELRTGGAGGHAGDLVEVDLFVELYLLGVDLEYRLAALEVGELDRDAAVKAARARERGVEGIRAVRGGEDDDAGVVLKAVHLGEQLVERLLALVVAAEAAVTLLADGVYLVYEHDAGGLLLGLAEEVAHLARAHAYEHLDKLGAGHGEEGHVGFAGDGLGEHGLAGSRRADEEDALGHRRADLAVLARVVEVIDYLGETLLGLVLARHVCKLDALSALDIDLGVGLAEGQGVGPAGALHELFAHQLTEAHKDDDGQYPADEEGEYRVRLLDDLAGELGAGVRKALREIGVRHHAGLVDGGLVLVGEEDLVVLLLHLHLAELLFGGHVHEGAVVHLLYLPLGEPGHGEEVEEQQHQQHDDVIEYKRFFRFLDFLHFRLLLSVRPHPAASPWQTALR